jgi:hypothetical protein
LVIINEKKIFAFFDRSDRCFGGDYFFIRLPEAGITRHRTNSKPEKNSNAFCG